MLCTRAVEFCVLKLSDPVTAGYKREVTEQGRVRAGPLLHWPNKLRSCRNVSVTALP